MILSTSFCKNLKHKVSYFFGIDINDYIYIIQVYVILHFVFILKVGLAVFCKNYLTDNVLIPQNRAVTILISENM